MNESVLNSIQSLSESLNTSMGLINRAMNRDDFAWERLVQLYFPMVFRWAKKCGMNNHDSEDIASEVMFKAVNKLKEFRKDRPDQMFRKWLWTITLNTVRDHFRKVDPLLHDGIEEDFPQPVKFEQPSVAEDRKALFARALNLVRQTTKNPKLYEAFSLVVVQGRNPTHVAEELGLNIGQVYQMKSRTLKRLKHEFGELIQQCLFSPNSESDSSDDASSQ